jgi:hypothetical protein
MLKNDPRIKKPAWAQLIRKIRTQLIMGLRGIEWVIFALDA